MSAVDSDRSEHDALDGIPSPSAAAHVLGHAEAMRALASSSAAGRLHHAWLFQGPRGIGKATLSFVFARRLLTDPSADESSIGATSDAVARLIASGAHPNVLHVTRPPAERGGFKTQITVEEIRRLNQFFQTTSGNGKWRIAIVDPIDDLNRSAANALLKILEEPPERSLFLMTNHLPGRLLPTVRSRCRVLRLEPLETSFVVNILNGFDLGIPAAELEAAALRAEGSVRNAVMLLADGGLEIESRLDALLGAGAPEWHGIQALADELSQRGQESAFDLAVTSLLVRLASESETAASGGHPGRARACARLWSDENARIREGLAFNLDRKQMLMTHFIKRFALRREATAD